MCEDCMSFAVVAAEFWSLQKKCSSQRTNRVRQTLSGEALEGTGPKMDGEIGVFAPVRPMRQGVRFRFPDT